MRELARRLTGAVFLAGTLLAAHAAGAQRQVVAPPAPEGFTKLGRVPLSGDPQLPPPPPPAGFSYRLATLSVPEAEPIVPLVPTVGGGETELFALAPGETLPAGLVLDPETGILSGLPTELLAPTLFTVVASNAGGETSTSLTIEVFGVAPQGLQYSPGTLEVELGGGPFYAVPTCRGGPVDSYSVVDVPLPSGLYLDPVEGSLSGQPTTLQAPTLFQIRAANETGESIFSFLIEVRLPEQPGALDYTPQGPFTFTFAPITPVLPSVSGRVDSFSVNPPLPNRMLTVSGGVAFPGSGIVVPENPTPISYAPPEQTFFHPWQGINVYLPDGSAPVDGWPCVLTNTNSGYFGAPPYQSLDPDDPTLKFFTQCLDAGIAIVFAGSVDSGPVIGWFYPPGHPSGRWEDFNEVMPEKDVLRAIQWVKTQTMFPLDGNRIFLHGVSAGATIAAYVALGPELALPSGSPQVMASSRVAGVLCFDVLTCFPAYDGLDHVVSHHWESVSNPGTSAVNMADADPTILDANSVARVLLDPLCNGATTPVFLAYDDPTGSINYSNDPDAFPALRNVVGQNVHDLWHGAKLWERLMWLNEGFHTQKSEFFVSNSFETTLGSMIGAETGHFTGTDLDSQELYDDAIAWLLVRAREAIPDPSGLQIHPKSGWIYGTPNQPSSPTAHHITATNPGGASQEVLVIGVEPDEP